MAARHAIKEITELDRYRNVCGIQCTVVCMYMGACTLNFVDLWYELKQNCSYLVIK